MNLDPNIHPRTHSQGQPRRRGQPRARPPVRPTAVLVPCWGSSRGLNLLVRHDAAGAIGVWRAWRLVGPANHNRIESTPASDRSRPRHGCPARAAAAPQPIRLRLPTARPQSTYNYPRPHMYTNESQAHTAARLLPLQPVNMRRPPRSQPAGRRALVLVVPAVLLLALGPGQAAAAAPADQRRAAATKVRMCVPCSSRPLRRLPVREVSSGHVHNHTRKRNHAHTQSRKQALGSLILDKTASFWKNEPVHTGSPTPAPTRAPTNVRTARPTGTYVVDVKFRFACH